MSSLLFISLRWLDILDILIVAGLLFQLYHLVKGTAAIRIFLGILTLLILWRITVALQMELISNILGQFLGIGVIAVIIIFQPEIRTFLVRLGTNRLWQDFMRQKQWSFNLFKPDEEQNRKGIEAITLAAFKLSKSKTGALMVIKRNSDLQTITDTGTELYATLTPALLESVFFKNNPLHDGATVCNTARVLAAGCQLPLTQSENINPKFGMRHRAAIGITEQTDALALVVSEENGEVHVVEEGEATLVEHADALARLLTQHLK